MTAGRVAFVGCGPGAPDLLTLRAVAALAAADIVIWNRTLLARQTLDSHTKGDAEIIEWPPATQDDVLAAFARTLAEDLLVVRLKGGDPTLFGRLEPELSAALDLGVSCEIVPGVSAVGAGAAALTCEIATPADPLLLVDAEGIVDAPRGPCRMGVYGANRDPRGAQSALLARGLAASTPCVVAIEVSRRDQALVACPLSELAETLEDHALGSLTVVLAGVSRGAVRGLNS